MVSPGNLSFEVKLHHCICRLNEDSFYRMTFCHYLIAWLEWQSGQAVCQVEVVDELLGWPKVCSIFLCDVMEKPEQTFRQPNALSPWVIRSLKSFTLWAAVMVVMLLKEEESADCPHPPRTSCGNPTTISWYSVWLSFPSYRWGIWSLSWWDNSDYRWGHVAGMSGGGILTLFFNQFIINTIPAFSQGPHLIRVLWWQSQWNTIIDWGMEWSLMSLCLTFKWQRSCDPGPLCFLFLFDYVYILKLMRFPSKLW